MADTQKPAPRRRGKQPTYDFDELTRKYPSLRTLAGPPTKENEKAWISAFTERPEAIEGVISDLIKHAYAKPGRIGQRPMPKEEDVNLQALIYGEFSDDPLTVALPKLIRISERAFCMKIHMSRRTYQRMYLPEGDPLRFYPDMELMRRMALAVGKPPSYFLEYRMVAAQSAFIRLLNDRPGIATRLYRDYLEVYKETPVPPRN